MKNENATAVRNIVRLMSTDINGNLAVINAMRKVKGVSFMFSHAVCENTGINPQTKVGTLSETDLKTLEAAIKAPVMPRWMLNRRKDPETNVDLHSTGTQIDLRVREDINSMKKMRSYKGVRHSLGQPVRGQRTRSTFRTNKRAVGAMKKKPQPGKAPAAPAATTSAKK